MKKRIINIGLLTLCIIIFSFCTKDYSEVKSIKITVDPNRKENKFSEVLISEKDSIKDFMIGLEKKERKIIKFYPRYKIEVNYENYTEIFLGNSNHLKNRDGVTYMLLKDNWFIYNY